METRFAVVIGLDVGKTGHHACALDPGGSRLFDKPLPQDEAQLRELFTELQKHGNVLMVVDQPNTIGALPIAVARDAGCAVAYLPGLAMRKAADLYPGRSKTDARDAFIIADTARTMPHTLRAVDRDNEVLSALKVLAGFDEDLAHETTRALNRIRSLLTQIHPALERVFAGGSLANSLTLELLIKYGGPTGLKTAGRGKVLRFARAHSRRDPEALIDQIFAALGEQTVVVPATAAVELVIPRVAGQVKELKEQRATVAREVEGMLEDFPLASVLRSMPGIAPLDRRADPPEHRRRFRVRDSRPPRGLRRDRAGHTKIRDLDPRRVPRPIGQQAAEERPVLLCLGRLEPRPDLEDLLRSQTRRGQAPQRRRDLPGPPPLQRHLRDAPRRHVLPVTHTSPDPRATHSRGLTRNIGTPPSPRDATLADK